MFYSTNKVISFHFLMGTVCARTIFSKNAFVLRATAPKSPLRVYNGDDDLNDKYPYVVALGIPKELFTAMFGIILNDSVDDEFVRTCSGTLITDEWVLSVAHCVGNGKLPTLIRYGDTFKNDTLARYSNVLRTMRYQTFSMTSAVGQTRITNDIGLLKVVKVSLASYGRISSVDYGTLVGLPVVLVGYGVTSQFPLPSISDNNKYLKYAMEHDPKHRKISQGAVVPCPKNGHGHPVICVAPKCSQNVLYAAMPGDSGGPLLQGGKIVGVGSYIDTPGLSYYTAVSPFLNWIVSKISSN